MSRDAIIGTGILLQAGDGSTPEEFVTVAEIVSLKPMQLSRNEIDVSTHNAARESKLLGMLRAGQVTGTLNWLPLDATHSSESGGMLGDILTNTWRNWRIPVPPEGLPILEFYGAVQSFDPQDVGVDAALQVAFALTLDADSLSVIEEEQS